MLGHFNSDNQRAAIELSIVIGYLSLSPQEHNMADHIIEIVYSSGK